MLKFACRTIEMGDIVRCSFGLTGSEYQVLLRLLSGAGTVQDISRRLKMERTGVQKALKGLVAKGLAHREKRNLPSGGFSFVYRPSDRKKIRADMKSSVKRWSAGVCRAIDGWK
jgi:predicted transcriptional regulator